MHMYSIHAHMVNVVYGLKPSIPFHGLQTAWVSIWSFPAPKSTPSFDHSTCQLSQDREETSGKFIGHLTNKPWDLPSGYLLHSHGFSMALIEIDGLPINIKKVDLSMAILSLYIYVGKIPSISLEIILPFLDSIVITRWYYSIVLYYNHPPKDRTTIYHHELMCGFCSSTMWGPQWCISVWNHRGIGVMSPPTGWWFGTWILFSLFSHILGMSSSQLTFIFFRGVGQPPTSQLSPLGLADPGRPCTEAPWRTWVSESRWGIPRHLMNWGYNLVQPMTEGKPPICQGVRHFLVYSQWFVNCLPWWWEFFMFWPAQNRNFCWVYPRLRRCLQTQMKPSRRHWIVGIGVSILQKLNFSAW